MMLPENELPLFERPAAATGVCVYNRVWERDREANPAHDTNVSNPILLTNVFADDLWWCSST